MEKSRSTAAASGAGPAQWADQISTLSQTMDPFGIGASFSDVAQGWIANPTKLASSLADLARDIQAMQLSAWQAAAGLQPTPVVRSAPDDARFADAAWTEQPAFALLKNYYLLYTHWLQESLFESPGVPAKERRQTTFWARQWLNAVAPSNFLFTNPVALRKAWESGGQSVGTGFKLWLDDLRVGDVQMVQRGAFNVGQNLATTPGSVVFRNELMELIQYAPTTPDVRAVPLLIIPPWINKYYILDLNDKKSMLRYLVNQGFTVFVISWKNPTSAQAETTFDDYLMKGMKQAIEVARAICQVPQVHAIGYCIGGSGLTALMAWLNREYADAASVPVAHWTLLATLVDFSRPGAVEVFIDERTIEGLEQMMAQHGYLDGREMSRAFRLLRSNSLIWQYFVNSYLYGEAPPPFDVLYWNTDVTRMPRAMHSYYLRNFYLDNALIRKDALTMAGHAIDLGRISQPLYAVGCEEDHIAPWKATFLIARHIAAPVRYTLSSSGHILGIVNPPVNPAKRSYWSGETNDGSPDEWHKHQRKVEGSWWDDWTTWLARRCGSKVAARPLGNADYPVICTAPGIYVHEI